MSALMRRRQFITLLGTAAAAWPLEARAQQRTMPVMGLLSTRAAGVDAHLLAAFHQGLRESGYVEGQNVAIEYRFADGQYDRLPALAADLVRRRVAVIASMGGIPAALAAKEGTATIPVVFGSGGDPVQLGLVASLNRPGGNLTGVSLLNTELGPKRLELLRELVPTATIVGVLLNPTNPLTELLSKDLQAAARTLGLQIHVAHASTERDIDAAFATLLQLRVGGLLIGTDSFLTSQIELLAGLTVRHALPTIYQFREFVAAGGLASYGASNRDQYRRVGLYTGRILKGEKPSDLPVEQATKVELMLNLKTAKALGLDMPMSILMRIDEVIE
jgi:putative ABC transport system substrate-binding protein